MSFFNLLLVNNDLWGSRGGEGKGKALPWSCLVAARLVQGLGTSEAHDEPRALWVGISSLLDHVPDEEKQSGLGFVG